MIIEVHQKGKIINRVPVEISSGNSYQGYTERKAIIDYEVAKLKKVYPLAQLWLAFESKMNPSQKIKTDKKLTEYEQTNMGKKFKDSPKVSRSYPGRDGT